MRVLHKLGGLVLGTSIAVGLSVGCGSDPQLDPVASSEEALLGICVQEMPGQYSAWLFDAKCECPYFGDQRDYMCAYEQGLRACILGSGGYFACERPPPLPIVGKQVDGKIVSYFEEYRIAVSSGLNCKDADALQRCIAGLNAGAPPQGGPAYADKPVAAEILPHCDPSLDPCAGKGIYNDIWDPCTTKLCAY